MSEQSYEVFEHSESMFEVVSDEEMRHPHLLADDFDDKVKLVEIAHGVTAATATELVGLSAYLTSDLEEGIARDGAFCVGNLSRKLRDKEGR